MLEEKVVIANATGLHARPAAKLVETCNPFKSSVTLLAGEKQVNAKSIMSVLMGSIGTGTEVTVRVEGEDEETAFAAVSEYLHNLPD